MGVREKKKDGGKAIFDHVQAIPLLPPSWDTQHLKTSFVVNDELQMVNCEIINRGLSQKEQI